MKKIVYRRYFTHKHYYMSGSIRYFYKRGALMRNTELCELFKNYCQGLSAFDVELPYNSSILNNWSQAVYLLSGNEQYYFEVGNQLRKSYSTGDTVDLKRLGSEEIETACEAVEDDVIEDTPVVPEPVIDHMTEVAIKHHHTKNRSAGNTRALGIPTFQPPSVITQSSSVPARPEITRIHAVASLSSLQATQRNLLEKAFEHVLDVDGVSKEHSNSSPDLEGLSKSGNILVHNPNWSLAEESDGDEEKVEKPAAMTIVPNGESSQSFDIIKQSDSVMDEEASPTATEDTIENNSSDTLKNDTTDLNDSLQNRLDDSESDSSMIEHDSPTAGHQLSYETMIERYSYNAPPEEKAVAEETKQLKNLTVEHVRQQENHTSEPTSSSNSSFEVLTNVDDLRGDDWIKHFDHVLVTLAKEQGLDIQTYKCRGCSCPIGMAYGGYRICAFDGYYYCHACHTNSESFVPSRILNNWDFSKHKVSIYAKNYLDDIFMKPKIDLSKTCTELYEHIAELKTVRTLRSQLQYLRAYLITCSEESSDKLNQLVSEKDHLCRTTDEYSLDDLIRLHSGELQSMLSKAVKFGRKHVVKCRLCSQKGFYCEICSSNQIIYPFELETTIQCSKCGIIVHRTCRSSQFSPCPKCERLKRRSSEPSRKPLADLVTTRELAY